MTEHVEERLLVFGLSTLIVALILLHHRCTHSVLHLWIMLTGWNKKGRTT